MKSVLVRKIVIELSREPINLINLISLINLINLISNRGVGPVSRKFCTEIIFRHTIYLETGLILLE